MNKVRNHSNINARQGNAKLKLILGKNVQAGKGRTFYFLSLLSPFKWLIPAFHLSTHLKIHTSHETWMDSPLVPISQTKRHCSWEAEFCVQLLWAFHQSPYPWPYGFRPQKPGLSLLTDHNRHRIHIRVERTASLSWFTLGVDLEGLFLQSRFVCHFSCQKPLGLSQFLCLAVRSISNALLTVLDWALLLYYQQFNSSIQNSIILLDNTDTW